MNDDLINSYTNAEYWVDEFNEPIKIGQINCEIEDLLKQNNSESWCFITAWNPMSKELPLSENRKRNNALKSDLSKYKIFEGEGRDPNGEWNAEQSFLVLDISIDNAKFLAKKYRQKAFIFAKVNKPPDLVIIKY